MLTLISIGTLTAIAGDFIDAGTKIHAGCVCTIVDIGFTILALETLWASAYVAPAFNL
tara:strand:- start:142 stop:315 length:174 start_codon:yes stop_codon:yes gene_type:complete